MIGSPNEGVIPTWVGTLRRVAAKSAYGTVCWVMIDLESGRRWGGPENMREVSLRQIDISQVGLSECAQIEVGIGGLELGLEADLQGGEVDDFEGPEGPGAVVAVGAADSLPAPPMRTTASTANKQR